MVLLIKSKIDDVLNPVVLARKCHNDAKAVQTHWLSVKKSSSWITYSTSLIAYFTLSLVSIILN